MKLIEEASKVGLAIDEDYETFYRRCFPRAVALAHALAGARLAEDIAQDAFSAAYQKWDTLEFP